MGFLDDMQGMMSNATTSAGRSVELMKLKSKVKDINQERTRLAAQLGAALYEKTKDDAAFVSSFGSLYQGIEKLDAERSEINAQMAQIEREGQERAEARQMYECPNCKSTFSSADAFCMGCGRPVGELLLLMQGAGSAFEAGGARTCPACGRNVDEEDAFCMGCGTDLRKATAEVDQKEDAQVSIDDEEPNDEHPDECQETTDESDPICPQCGNEVQADDRFCMNCGCKLA